jgi:hypothetical protein
VTELAKIPLLPSGLMAVCVDAANEAVDAASKRPIKERLGSEIIVEKSLPCRMRRMRRMTRAGLTPRSLRNAKRHLGLLHAATDATDATDNKRLFLLYCVRPRVRHAQGECNPPAGNPLRWVAPTLQ